ncbi:MAG: DUF488 domain-containing protein [Synergistota bacterium]|nr:DUF488 domain-containing protein [Synergistota bacterium]
MSSIEIKRIYTPAEATDGKRILVDRLWPRGITKERASLYFWQKDIAPSAGLRIWFGHNPEKFDEFARRYMAELDTDPTKLEAVRQLLEIAKIEKLTLLYASTDTSINHALIIKNFLLKKLPDESQTE